MKKNHNRTRFISLLLLASLTAGRGWAQSSAPLGMFGGYSYVRLNSAGGGAATLHGWTGGAQFDLRHSLGLEAEAAGQYGNQSGANLSLYTFLAGPRVAHNSRHTSLFLHVLLGTARLSARAAGLSDHSSGFATVFGGGLEVKPSPRVGVRMVQADYLSTHIADRNQNNLRLSGGLVFYVSPRPH